IVGFALFQRNNRCDLFLARQNPIRDPVARRCSLKGCRHSPTIPCPSRATHRASDVRCACVWNLSQELARTGADHINLLSRIAVHPLSPNKEFQGWKCSQRLLWLHNSRTHIVSRFGSFHNVTQTMCTSTVVARARTSEGLCQVQRVSHIAINK